MAEQQTESTENPLASIAEASQNEDSILIQEQELKAPSQLFGGRILQRNGSGILRKVLVPTCDACGLRISPDVPTRICSETQSVICDRCSVVYQNVTYCVKCLKSRLDMNEFDFDVLNSALESRVSISSIVAELIVPAQKVRASLSTLTRAGLVRRISISVLAKYEATPVAKHNLQAIQKLFNVEPTGLKKLDDRK
jgi:hypothetical protein